MKLLALETSSALFSVALSTEEKCLKYDQLIQRHSAQQVLPVIEQLCVDGGLSLSDLDALVLGIGPGSFTGLRISSSVVQALAFVHELPVILISSLRACAQEAFETWNCAQVLVGFNAYQGEVYWGGYQADAAGRMQTVIPDSLAAPDLLVIPKHSGWVGVGNAWEVYDNALNAHCKEILSQVHVACYPRATTLLTLAEVEYLQKNFVTAEAAVPAYLRGHQAWKKSAL